jgi:EmrB/QacA subfamily drug resistance transporter
MQTRSKYAVALTASLGLIMAILDNTVVNVALVPIANSLKTDLTTIEWVVTGYFLAQAAIIPVSGYFSNRFGIKRVFMICLFVFTLGSTLCALSTSETMLISFRVLQGLGGGALFPLAQAIAFGAFPPSQRASAGAIIGVPVLLAPAFGPTIGGWLTVNFDWQSIFLVNLPIGVIALVLSFIILPADKASEPGLRKGFDYMGLVLSTLGVLAVVYAFTLVSQTQPGTITPTSPNGQLYGWGYWLVWALLGLGVALLVIFALYELLVSKDPVMDLRLFKERNFTLSSIVSWVNAAVVFGSLLLLPIFLQQIRIPNLSPLDSGLALVPQGLASAVGVILSGLLYNRVGVRPLVVVGGILLTISSWLLATQVTPASDGYSLMPMLIIRGLGFGLTLIPVQTLALEAIVGPALPKASSLYNVTRQIFSSIGVAATITLLVQQTTSHATVLIQQAQSRIPAGVKIDPNSPQAQAALKNILSQAGTQGFQDVFIYVTFGTIALTLIAFALPGRRTISLAGLEASEAGQKPGVMVE